MYATASDIINDYLPEHAGDPAIEDVVERIIVGVSAAIDSYCRMPAGYFDVAPAAATMRQFRGEDRRYLRLPVHIIGTVSVAGIDSASVYEHPRSGWLHWKKADIEPFDNYDWVCYRTFKSSVVYEVTARWGWPAVPDAINEVTRQLTARIFEKRRGVIGETVINDLAFSEIRFSPFAQDVLEAFKRREFQVV